MPFTIKVVYDRSVSAAPAGFKATVNAVVHFFETHFTAPVTISIGVGYGEVDHRPLGPGNLGQSSYNLYSYNYSDITAALAAHATTSADHAALASLPVLSPVDGSFWLSQAQAKALGLLGDTGGVDGSIGFAAASNFTFNRSLGVKAGSYDFFGAVAHEISEVMGRFLLVGSTTDGTPNSYSLLDLFHFSSAGNRDFSGTQPGYFSINKASPASAASTATRTATSATGPAASATMPSAPSPRRACSTASRPRTSAKWTSWVGAAWSSLPRKRVILWPNSITPRAHMRATRQATLARIGRKAAPSPSHCITPCTRASATGTSPSLTPTSDLHYRTNDTVRVRMEPEVVVS